MTKRGKHLLIAKEAHKLVTSGERGRHRDGGSLFLEVSAPGRARWIYRYGKNNTEYAIGTYADVSLPEARAAHEQAREWVAKGLNPSQQRKLLKAEAEASSVMTFRDLADEWLDAMRPNWSPVHYKKSKQAIARDVTPTLGDLPVASITPAMVHSALEPLAQRAPETASRVRQHLGLIFDRALVRGLRDTNPVVKIAGRTRSTGKLHNKQPALLRLTDLGKVLRDTEAANTSPVVRIALWLLSRTAVRPGELVPTQWSEFELDGDDPRWRVPRERMKTQSRDEPHAVPLSPAVVARLRDWQRVAPKSKFVFASTSARNKTGHIGVEGLEKCYRVTLNLRGKHVPHGWRSAFNTLAHDAIDSKGRRLWDEDVVEIALDHTFGGKVRQAYDRGERWEARRLLMQWWSDQLDQAERGADVVWRSAVSDDGKAHLEELKQKGYVIPEDDDENDDPNLWWPVAVELARSGHKGYATELFAHLANFLEGHRFDNAVANSVEVRQFLAERIREALSVKSSEVGKVLGLKQLSNSRKSKHYEHYVEFRAWYVAERESRGGVKLKRKEVLQRWLDATNYEIDDKTVYLWKNEIDRSWSLIQRMREYLNATPEEQEAMCPKPVVKDLSDHS